MSGCHATPPAWIGHLLSWPNWKLSVPVLQDRASTSFADTVAWGELRNLLLSAVLITRAASQREESRGAHYRSDFPAASPAWQHRRFISLRDFDALRVPQQPVKEARHAVPAGL